MRRARLSDTAVPCYLDADEISHHRAAHTFMLARLMHLIILFCRELCPPAVAATVPKYWPRKCPNKSKSTYIYVAGFNVLWHNDEIRERSWRYFVQWQFDCYIYCLPLWVSYGTREDLVLFVVWPFGSCCRVSFNWLLMFVRLNADIEEFLDKGWKTLQHQVTRMFIKNNFFF